MTRHSAELHPDQRRKEKYELFKRFMHRAIEDVFKGKLFALFDHRCFKCGVEGRSAKVIGKPPVLCIDHHIPMALGGHFVPGNLVALCRRCNEAKLDQAPEHYFSEAELQRLRPLLEQQPAIFDFNFDWDAWNLNREQYLLSLGVELGLVQELLYNPDHPYFIGTRSPAIGFTISLDD